MTKFRINTCTFREITEYTVHSYLMMPNCSFIFMYAAVFCKESWIKSSDPLIKWRVQLSCGNFATLSTFLLGPAFIMFSFHHLQATWNKGSWSKTPKSCARTTLIPNMSYSMCSAYCLQVILCQKHSFLHQLTQHMTTAVTQWLQKCWIVFNPTYFLVFGLTFQYSRVINRAVKFSSVLAWIICHSKFIVKAAIAHERSKAQ